jgi:hypothetical protein
MVETQSEPKHKPTGLEDLPTIPEDSVRLQTSRLLSQ